VNAVVVPARFRPNPVAPEPAGSGAVRFDLSRNRGRRAAGTAPPAQPARRR
jgi:hypothetical protein